MHVATHKIILKMWTDNLKNSELTESLHSGILPLCFLFFIFLKIVACFIFHSFTHSINKYLLEVTVANTELAPGDPSVCQAQASHFSDNIQRTARERY